MTSRRACSPPFLWTKVRLSAASDAKAKAWNLSPPFAYKTLKPSVSRPQSKPMRAISIS